MISRRAFITRSAGDAMTLALRVASGFAADSRRITPVHFSMPRGACDCHVHIFNPKRFPYWSSRSATPESASIRELLDLERGLHMDRVVLVQPSAYGTDNACMLDALRQLGSRARGVAVVGEQTTEAQLDEMNHAGVRGIRIILESSDKENPGALRRRFQTAVQQAADHNWHIQMGAGLPAIETIQNQLAGTQVPIVVEHFARAEARLGQDQAGFVALLNLLRQDFSPVPHFDAATRLFRRVANCPSVYFGQSGTRNLGDGLAAPKRRNGWPHSHRCNVPD
jgi:hypothetical protein